MFFLLFFRIFFITKIGKIKLKKKKKKKLFESSFLFNPTFKLYLREGGGEGGVRVLG